MAKIPITGTYKLERNENLDEFYKAAGVPWIARKMMLATSPTVTVTQTEEERGGGGESDEGDTEGEGGDEGAGGDTAGPVWLIRSVTFTRTIDLSFKLNEPFEETLPSGDIYQTTVKMEGDNKFILDSVNEEKGAFMREYEFKEDGFVLAMKHPSGVEAKRYFKRTGD